MKREPQNSFNGKIISFIYQVDWSQTADHINLHLVPLLLDDCLSP